MMQMMVKESIFKSNPRNVNEIITVSPVSMFVIAA
jgi:hypothetical protein